MRLMQEAGEPEWAPLKAMVEKKVWDHLADYGEYYSVLHERVIEDGERQLSHSTH